MQYFNVLFITGVVIIASSNCHIIYDDDGATVPTPLGKVKGSHTNSRLNKTIYTFRGIRYAEPPVGDLRFQPPVPAKPWKEVFDASKEGPSCPQARYNDTSEDCLRLNVYTTKLPCHNNKVKRPVIVFIHPGGFFSYSGQKWNFGPEYLLDKDVVLVTINYRLGSLGFLSTGDALIPGNMGMKDQVVALRWIRDNIHVFGGDPNSVTITGCSAGSWSAILHTMSPMSQGLFHRIIAMSGSPTTHSETPKNQTDLVFRQAQYVGCPNDNLIDAVKCLKTKPADEIGKSKPKFHEYYGDPILIWRPVIEPDVPGIERFLTDDPEILLQKGEFANVPVIIGVTKDEFAGVLAASTAAAKQGNEHVFDEINQPGAFHRIAPISVGYERNSNRSRCISDKLREFYFNNQNVSLSNVRGYADLYADPMFFQVQRYLNLATPTNTAAVYFYNFVYQGRYSYFYYPNTKTPYGVSHQDDLQYLFTLPNFPALTAKDPEIITVERMTTMFEHFARTGIPFPDDELFNNVKWIPYSNENNAYLEIGDTLSMKHELHKKKMEFWYNLFPIKRAV